MFCVDNANVKPQPAFVHGLLRVPEACVCFASGKFGHRAGRWNPFAIQLYRLLLHAYSGFGAVNAVAELARAINKANLPPDEPPTPPVGKP